jgi:hypothetical protein
MILIANTLHKEKNDFITKYKRNVLLYFNNLFTIILSFIFQFNLR